MTLPTNLDHIATTAQYEEILSNNKNVMLCVGRMGPMCVPVYSAMESLRKDYSNVKFMDMAFDSHTADVIRALPETNGFMGLPFTLYFQDGKIVKATSSIQSNHQIKEVLDTYFSH